MNPLNFEEVIKQMGIINKAIYGVNPYEEKKMPDAEKDSEYQEHLKVEESNK